MGESARRSGSFLRLDLIRRGDVLLSRSGGRQGKVIARLTGGTFSHASLVIGSDIVFESDGGLVGHKKITELGWAKLGNELVHIGELEDVTDCAVYRHPAMNTMPEERFTEALELELRESYGKDYSELYRLLQMTRLPAKLTWLTAAATKLYEDLFESDRIPGPFCSELVARFFARMDIPLFSDARSADRISPNDLANSTLVLVDAAVLDQLSVSTLEMLREGRLGDVEANMTPWLTSKGDLFAIRMRQYRGSQRAVDHLHTLSEGLSEFNRNTMEHLLELFAKNIPDVASFVDNSSHMGGFYVRKRAAHVLQLCADVVPEFERASEGNDINLTAVRTLSKKLGIFDRAFVRSDAILKSRRMKNSLLRKPGIGFLLHLRVRRARRKNLLIARRSVERMIAHDKLMAGWHE